MHRRVGVLFFGLVVCLGLFVSPLGCLAAPPPGQDSGISDDDGGQESADAGDGGRTDAGDGGRGDAGEDGGPTEAAEDWKNWYAVTWRDTAENNLKYAKQMGHQYIGVHEWSGPGFGYSFYKHSPNASGRHFFFTDPYNYRDVFKGFQRFLDPGWDGGYTQQQIDFFNANMVWKSPADAGFPNNLATGYPGPGTSFSVVWDFQQQRVIDEVVERIIVLAHKYEADAGDLGYPFTFAGAIFDTGTLSGDFAVRGRGLVTLAHWTGSESGLQHAGVTHDYATYSDGRAAFFKKLRTRMQQEFPGSRFILCPSRIYHPTWIEEVVRHIANRPDRDELTPDMLSQEDSSTTAFVDDLPLYRQLGIKITADRIGISQVSQSSEPENRLYNAKAAIYGSWSNWFGLYGETSGTPNFTKIVDVYPRLKLVRMVPNWDNLNSVPLAARSWRGGMSDGGVYESPNSHIDSDVIYTRQPGTGKLFVVFNSTNGAVKLRPGESVASMWHTDGYFIESQDASMDFLITGQEIRLKSTVPIDVDSTNRQVKGKGYIIVINRP